jgi:glyoxylase-like metal-dependent hydrolase (beta-lactamase superfamily II)
MTPFSRIMGRDCIDANDSRYRPEAAMVDELRPGLWTWTAPHPAWTPDDGGPEGWEQDVRSYAYDADDVLVLFDPMSPPAEIVDLARGRPLSVLLTMHWHQRSSVDLAVGHGATIHAPAEKAEEVEAPALPYRLGDALPGGVEPQVGGYPEEATLWIPEHRALVIGDVFLGGEGGFRVQPDSWLAEGLTPAELRERLRPLLDLPVELLLPTHGDPVEDGRDVLARAVST